MVNALSKERPMYSKNEKVIARYKQEVDSATGKTLETNDLPSKDLRCKTEVTAS